MIAKLGTTIGCLAVLLLAVVVFITQKQQSPKDQFLSSTDNEPRIVLEDFSIFRYNDQKVEMTFSAKLGHFLEPNIVEAYASVRGVRYKDKNKIESLHCESATAYLIADSMNDLMSSSKGAELSRAEVEDQVQIGFDGHTMNTEFAEFSAPTNIVSSNEEVRVDGPNRTLFGKDGFRYDLKREYLEMGGQVSGVLTPEKGK